MDIFFEQYLGDLFYKIIDSYEDNLDIVVEFAPGFRTKVAYGLKKLDFKGNLYVIDNNLSVLDFIKEEYAKILPQATLICLPYTLLNSINFLPKKIDLLLANHPLDDMIIAEFLKENSYLAFDNTEESKDYLYKSWEYLVKNKSKLELTKQKVLEEFIQFFKNIDIRLIVLSQYRSAYYIEAENIVDLEVRDLFLRLKEIVKTNNKKINSIFDFYVEDFDVAKKEGFGLKDNIQNSKNWIVGRYGISNN